MKIKLLREDIKCIKTYITGLQKLGVPIPEEVIRALNRSEIQTMTRDSTQLLTMLERFMK